MKEEEIKHQLEYSVYSCKVTWCPICNAHFYNERNVNHTTEATSEHYHTIPAPVKPVDITVLINKINERIRLIPDEPNLSQRGALDAYLNVISWAKDKAIENTTLNTPIQSGVEEAIKDYAERFGGIEYGLTYISFKAGAEWQAKQVKQPVSSNDIHATSLAALDKFLNKISKEELKSMLDKHQVIDGSGITFGEYLANIGGEVKQPVMQWVKASERLPGNTQDDIVWRHTSNILAGMGFKKNNGFEREKLGIYFNEYDLIEWLEQPPIQ